MKVLRSRPIRCPRGRVTALLTLLFLMALGGAGRTPPASSAEGDGAPRKIPPPALQTVDPYDGRLLPIDCGSFLFDPEAGEELLGRGDDGDLERFDLQWITVESGGEVEVGDSHIDIPPFALAEDTWMALYVPLSGNIEYWAYPPDIRFDLPVEVRFSYKHADSTGVNEQGITIDQWLPQFQLWDIVGGVVDTLSKQVTADVMRFPPGVVDSVAQHSRFALADHN